jgi:hypothetical protein
MDILNRDRNFGFAKEAQVIHKLSTHFNETCEPTPRYCKYDAISPTKKFEIKSRRNKHNTYPTTLIPVDKSDVEGELYFVFRFVDKLMYIEYTEEKFSNYEIRDISAVRGGGVYTLKPHYLIDVADLIEIVI